MLFIFKKSRNQSIDQSMNQDLEKEKSLLGVEKKNKEIEVDQSLAAITK